MSSDLVFGLLPDYRTQDVDYTLGKHCANKCSMQEPLTVQDVIKMTRDRLDYGALCSPCKSDLKAYFSEGYRPHT